jgi:NADH:ubiquinone oxidoreductase subunit K
MQKSEQAAWISSYYLSQKIAHTLRWLCTLCVTVFFRRNIIILSVSFTAEIMLCSVEIQTVVLFQFG